MKTNKSSLPRILIFGGQLIIATDIYIQLLNMGYPVIGIQNHMEGVLKCVEKTEPDIVIVELNYIDKETSITLARTLMERYHIPVILLSADICELSIQQLLRLNPYAIITMPFDPASLKRGIKLTEARILSEAG